MNIKLISDVHLEHHPFLLTPKFSGEEVFIIAGDLAPFTMRQDAINYIEEYLNSGGKRVIYIMGNHEYYGSDIDSVNKFWNNYKNSKVTICNENANILFVDNILFVGVTLWCDLRNIPKKLSMKCNDFNAISDFNTEIESKLNQMSLDSLNLVISSFDKIVVISHHAPVKQSKITLMDKFFYNNLTEWLKDKNIQYWFHGHTHKEETLKIYNTLIRSFKDNTIQDLVITF